MPPPVIPSADSPDAPNARAASTWRTLGRHQIGSVVATAADFLTMIAFVQCFGVPPVGATAIGATVGAVTNFLLGRAWIFPRHRGHVTAQAFRYALVSGASAGWNVLGEHVLHDREHLQYVGARALVSLAVSLAWNFPLQRWFVFQERRPA
jgi:putative flippase GtrA